VCQLGVGGGTISGWGGGEDGGAPCLAPRCRRIEWRRVPLQAGIRLESVKYFSILAALFIETVSRDRSAFLYKQK
jgi:hypothetical protein